MSFPLGEKDKSYQPSKETNTRKHPLESITDLAKRDEIERGGMIMGPHHPGFRSESSEGQHEIQEDDQTQKLRLPQGSVPHGARFDPIVPDDQTHPDQIGSERYGYRPIAGPDNDELLPPGQETPKVTKQTIKPPRTGEGFGRGNFSGGSGGGGFTF
jgi:hypothetical protein